MKVLSFGHHIRAVVRMRWKYNQLIHIVTEPFSSILSAQENTRHKALRARRSLISPLAVGLFYFQLASTKTLAVRCLATHAVQYERHAVSG